MLGCMVNAQRNYVREVDHRQQEGQEEQASLQAEGKPEGEHRSGQEAAEQPAAAEGRVE
ncbi:MAG: hypothetical protein ACOC1T_01925 [Halorhodospira sp.]